MTEPNAPTAENVDQTIADIEALLAESDPDFIKELQSIKIDNSSVNMSLMDEDFLQAEFEREIAAKKPQAPPKGVKRPFTAVLLETAKKPFAFRENFKQVVFFWVILFSILAGLFYFIKVKHWDQQDSLFLTSYAQWNADVQDYNPQTDSELFFDNPRLTKNLVTIKRMVANVQKSENSSDSPMLALELNIEGMNNEVVVEIKDREAEFKDLILRTVETFNYDFLTTTEGKQSLSEKLTTTLNSNLTKGQIRKVLYKSFVLKN